MAKKLPKMLSLTAAVAALSGTMTMGSPPATANALAPDEGTVSPQGRTNTGKANVFLPAGRDLLGLIVTTNEHGAVVAQHDSHYSHSSHASHRSHYSSN